MFVCYCIYVFSDKAMVAGQQTALGLSIIATVNMVPMSPKTSWISQTILLRRPSDNLFLKVCRSPLLILHILALQPLVVGLAPQAAHTNRMKLLLSLEREVHQVCQAWRS